MKRRSFIKSSALIGAAATGTSLTMSMQSCSTDVNKPKFTERYVKERLKPAVIQLLENSFIKAEILSNAQIVVLDKSTGQEWKTFTAAIQDEGRIEEGMLWTRNDRGHAEMYPGFFEGEKSGDNLKFIMRNRLTRFMGAFTVRYSLEDRWLKLQILEVDDCIPSLVFPPPFESDALVLPIGQGKLIRKTDPDVYCKRYLNFFAPLTMRMISGLKNNNNGWIAAFDYDSPDMGAMYVNSQIAPVWLRSMGKWQGNYCVSFAFTGGGYVGIAKTYRKYAQDHKLFKTLNEKFETHPQLRNMLGGRALQFMQSTPAIHSYLKDENWFNDEQIKKQCPEEMVVTFTYKQVKEKVEMARKMGFKKGMVLLRGWSKKGFDAEYPNEWPPEPALGRVDELKELMTPEENIVKVMHDNYCALHDHAPSFPDAVRIRPDGSLMQSGVWGGSQQYWSNTKNVMKFAESNWNQIKQMGVNGMFIDCLTCDQMRESYGEGNLLTKREDLQWHFNLLKMYHDQGQIIGSEEIGEYAIPIIHWAETRFKRTEGESIPLWYLVYHDCQFVSRYNCLERTTPYPGWLLDMLYGNFMRFWVPGEFGNGGNTNPDTMLYGWGDWQLTDEQFKNTYHVDEWHEKVGTLEMTMHEFLTEDKKVERTTFGDKYQIIVNFDLKDRVVNGTLIKGHGYKINS